MRSLRPAIQSRKVAVPPSRWPQIWLTCTWAPWSRARLKEDSHPAIRQAVLAQRCSPSPTWSRTAWPLHPIHFGPALKTFSIITSQLPVPAFCTSWNTNRDHASPRAPHCSNPTSCDDSHSLHGSLSKHGHHVRSFLDTGAPPYQLPLQAAADLLCPWHCPRQHRQNLKHDRTSPDVHGCFIFEM